MKNTHMRLRSYSGVILAKLYQQCRGLAWTLPLQYTQDAAVCQHTRAAAGWSCRPGDQVARCRAVRTVSGVEQGQRG